MKPTPADAGGHRPPLAVGAAEAARLLGISRAGLLKLASAGRFPAPVRIGRRVLWPVAELERWLAAGAPPRDRWEALRGEVRP